MLQPYELIPGPDYPNSLAQARQDAGLRFEEHLEALLSVARLTPMDSDPIAGDRVRVRETEDSLNDYRVMLCYEVNPHRFTCELKWVHVGPLEPGSDPWAP